MTKKSKDKRKGTTRPKSPGLPLWQNQAFDKARVSPVFILISLGYQKHDYLPIFGVFGDGAVQVHVLALLLLLLQASSLC